MAATPSGVICIWSGAIADIPYGWSLCDGNNGTPNLQDKFVVGAGSSYSVNSTGGSHTISLSSSEIPSHDHSSNTLSTDSQSDHSHDYEWDYSDTALKESKVDGALGGDGSGNTTTETTSNSGSHKHSMSGTSSSTGSGSSHENKPPYYALAYIQKD